MRHADKDFSPICIIFCHPLRPMIFVKIPFSYENHLSTCQGWGFNQKIGTGSIFQIWPCHTTLNFPLSFTVWFPGFPPPLPSPLLSHSLASFPFSLSFLLMIMAWQNKLKIQALFSNKCMCLIPNCEVLFSS